VVLIMAVDAWGRPISTQSGPDCDLNAFADALELVSGEGIDYSRKFLQVESERTDATIQLATPFVGMSLRATASAIHRIGVCAESLCAYDWPDKVQPNPEAYADAEKRIDWFELEQIGHGDIDAAIAMPNTVVVVSHYVNSNWTEAKADSVLEHVYSDAASHATILCERLADGTYRDRNSWGPGWADRGTVRVSRGFVDGTLDRWRVTYKGPLFGAP